MNGIIVFFKKTECCNNVTAATKIENKTAAAHHTKYFEFIEGNPNKNDKI